MSYGKMNRSDITIVSVDTNNGDMLVGAKMGTVGLTWPGTVEYDNEHYRFKSQEVMNSELAKEFGGLAKYERINT